MIHNIRIHCKKFKKSISFKNIDNYKIEIFFINLIILAYVLRSAIPQLKFLFLIIYVGLIVYSITNFKKKLLFNVIEFSINYYLIVFLAFLVIISFIFSNKLYLTIFKDVINSLILVSIFILLTLFVNSKKEFNFFVSNFVWLLVLFASVISFLELLELVSFFPIKDHDQNQLIPGNLIVDPFQIDYNFSLLSAFFGIICIISFLIKKNSNFNKFIFNFLLLLFSLNIILAGSRRGIIIFLFIVLYLTIAKFTFLFNIKNTVFAIGSQIGTYLVSLALLVFFLTVFLLYSTSSFKTKTFELMGSKNVFAAKTRISFSVFRCITVFDHNATFSYIHERIWEKILDSDDPESGWGTDRTHKMVYPLFGENVKIVPKTSIGYLMDSTCNATYYSSNNVSDSYSLMVNLSVNKGDNIKASVYCFVSDDFDANTAYLGVGSSCINANTVSGTLAAYYDLEKKGVWQKLEIDLICNKGEVPLYMCFWKGGVKNFSKMKGFIIFAHPTYEKFSKSVISSSLCIADIRQNSRPMKSIYFLSHIVEKENNATIVNSNAIENQDKYFRILRDSVNKTQDTKCSFSNNNIEYSSLLNIFDFSLQNLFFFMYTINNDHDPIRNLASKFISEDTTYYPFKANLVADTISNSFSGPRLARWEFAIKIFSKEYNLKQKLFGGGFNFLNWYGYVFDGDKTRSDYPHNPFLSILLYSGIFGLIIYCFFLYKVFYYYIKYIKEYPLLFIFFLIIFFFSFFSSGSPFDPPIMGFFIILPFFIHSIHKNEEKTLTEPHLMNDSEVEE